MIYCLLHRIKQSDWSIAHVIIPFIIHVLEIKQSEPLNNFSYSTPTIVHAHKVIKCQFQENLVGNEWLRTLAINARVVGSNPGYCFFLLLLLFFHLLK